MASNKPTGHIIKAKKLKDGFTFKLSMDHIIEQTLLKHYNSPHFRKSTIQIDDQVYSGSDSDSDSDVSSGSSGPSKKRAKGVPIKLQLKRQYAEEPNTSDADNVSGSKVPPRLGSRLDQPIDMSMSTKKIKKEKSKPLESITSIPPGWIMKGLKREDYLKFQSALSRASLTPHERKQQQQQYKSSS